MTEKIILTSAGVDKLKKELQHLKKDRRLQIAERIKAAKEYGDLSENAEYHDAKEEQSFVEGRIAEIDQILKIAYVVDSTKASEIGVGSTVVLGKDTAELVYEIVGSTEADPSSGKISVDSPLGQALIGKNVGQSIEIKTPTGTVSYIIKETR